MIFERTIFEALTPDELDVAKASVRTRDVGRITRERYEAIHGGALRRLRSSVPTQPVGPGCSGSAS